MKNLKKGAFSTKAPFFSQFNGNTETLRPSRNRNGANTIYNHKHQCPLISNYFINLHLL